MKLLLLLLALAANTLSAQSTDWTQYVNPLIGTQSSDELSNGNTYPAIARPWGMNCWTPQTGKMGDGWQYTYTATHIRGFKQNHQPSPWINDYGQFSLMPFTYQATFSGKQLTPNLCDARTQSRRHLRHPLLSLKHSFVQMLDSVFSVPPLFDESYYGQVVHEIREMQLMNMGNYAHGNQPIQHMIYLYNYAGQPWKSQYWLREVMNRLYTPTPDGYCGDEDNGQTSAWYVFSALGFYPVCPGTNEYVLGAPLFQKAVLHFEQGKSLVLDAPQNSAANRYVHSATLNGKEYTKNFLKHGELLKGGMLHYGMSPAPNYARGTKTEDYPYSFSSSHP